MLKLEFKQADRKKKKTDLSRLKAKFQYMTEIVERLHADYTRFVIVAFAYRKQVLTIPREMCSWIMVVYLTISPFGWITRAD